MLPCLPAVTVLASYPSGTVIPTRPFLLEVALVMVFYHNVRKVPNIPRCIKIIKIYVT